MLQFGDMKPRFASTKYETSWVDPQVTWKKNEFQGGYMYVGSYRFYSVCNMGTHSRNLEYPKNMEILSLCNASSIPTSHILLAQ